jgi:hypothetical protein
VRQFITLRFWLALGALAVLAVVVAALDRADRSANVVALQQTERQIDLVHWVYLATPGDGFAVRGGVTTADVALQIDGTRTMVVKQGTPGEITCPDIEAPGTCTVAADLLGDAVLWFALIEGSPETTIELPAVTELLGGGKLRLSNNWVVNHAPKVERSCPADTSSLTDFINTFGDDATSTFDFESQRVVKVTCPSSAGA